MAAAAETPIGRSGSSNPNVARIAIEQRKKKTEVVEPQVISEELLIAGVEEPVKPEGEPWEPIEFPQVASMCLSFQNIIEISNLNQFVSMTTLRLDNNIIDKIQHLSHLKQLTWLDLSFNNIQVVEGLGGLDNLTDLSLYHNKIEKIEGLDGCAKLNVLSLGHNNISELKQIEYLRKFQNLRCVCLQGNKVCQKENYNNHVLAYLTRLKYKDYALIDRKAVTSAQEGYQADDISELKEKEEAEASKLRELKAKSGVLLELKNSFLDYTEDLFDELFSKEAEPEALLALTCYQPLKEEYRDKLAEFTKNFRVYMEDENVKRQKKVVAFERAIQMAERESEDEAFELVKEFRSTKKKVLTRLERDDSVGGRQSSADDLLDDLRKENSGLEEHLMRNEIMIQESIEEAIGDQESKINDIVKRMLEKGGEFFRQLEEQEKQFLTNIQEASNGEIESFLQNQETMLSDQDLNKQKYLGSKDEMQLAITTFTDAHSQLLGNKEDYMSSLIQNWQKTFFDGHRNKQYVRNRQRIIDIKKVVDEFKEEIDSAMKEEYEEDDQHGADGGYH